MRCSASIIICASIVLAAPVMATSIQTTGHTDIQFVYDSSTGEAYLEYHLDAGSTVDGVRLTQDTSYAPGDLITFIPNPPFLRPGGSAWDFTGAAAAAPLWYIPFSQQSDRPWTGISTEEVSPADFSNIRYELTAFSGPGQMSVAQFGPFGDPRDFFRTVDGLSSADVISAPAGTHAHFAWFFTVVGGYTFDLTVTGTLTGGGTVTATDTFTFLVVVEPELPGDMNCDGSVNFDDIDGFVAAVIGQSAYEAAYPDCSWLSGDVDASGSVNFDDIDGFVGCVIAGGCL